MSAPSQSEEPLCHTPRKRMFLWWVCILYVAFLFLRNTVLLQNRSPAMQCLQPPFEIACLFLGGNRIQARVEVWLEDQHGKSELVDLKKLFHYRLPHRPHICGPERCEALVRTSSKVPHQKLADFVLNSHNEKYPESPAVKSSVFLVSWDLCQSDGTSETERELMATSTR